MYKISLFSSCKTYLLTFLKGKILMKLYMRVVAF